MVMHQTVFIETSKSLHLHFVTIQVSYMLCVNLTVYREKLEFPIFLFF